MKNSVAQGGRLRCKGLGVRTVVATCLLLMVLLRATSTPPTQQHQDENRLKALEEEDQANQRWFEWVQTERNISFTSTDNVIFVHRGVSGLGHILTRWASTFHLAKCLNVSRLYLEMNPNFKQSPRVDAIPNYLFGSPIVVVSSFNQSFSKLGLDPTPKKVVGATVPILPNSHPHYRVLSLVEEKQTRLQGGNTTTSQPQPLRRKIIFVNDPPGYQPLFALNNFHRKQLLDNNWYGKLQSDAEFYQQLLWLFSAQPQHQTRIQKVVEDMKEIGGRDPIVFGLHVRQGNGERHDFYRKRRQIVNLEQWIYNMLNMLNAYLHTSKVFAHRPLVLFLATDSIVVVESVKKAMADEPHNTTNRISLVTVTDHDYLRPGLGVTFDKQYRTSQEALKSWQDMMLDMYLLAQHCTVVIAGQYSSFTQSIPFTMMFQKARVSQQSNGQSESQHPLYVCQIGPQGDVMECFDSFVTWHLGKPSMSIGNSTAPRQRLIQQSWFPANFRGQDPLENSFRGTAIVIPARRAQARR